MFFMFEGESKKHTVTFEKGSNSPFVAGNSPRLDLDLSALRLLPARHLKLVWRGHTC